MCCALKKSFRAILFLCVSKLKFSVWAGHNTIYTQSIVNTCESLTRSFVCSFVRSLTHLLARSLTFLVGRVTTSVLSLVSRLIFFKNRVYVCFSTREKNILFAASFSLDFAVATDECTGLLGLYKI